MAEQVHTPTELSGTTHDSDTGPETKPGDITVKNDAAASESLGRMKNAIFAELNHGALSGDSGPIKQARAMAQRALDALEAD